MNLHFKWKNIFIGSITMNNLFANRIKVLLPFHVIPLIWKWTAC